MKTTIEVQGYEIKIDEMNDKIMVSAEKDGETVQEFELEIEPGFEDDDMGGMEPFEGEEEDDFDSDDMDDMEDEEMDDDDMEDEEMDDDDMEEMEEEDDQEEESKLESFSHFVKKRKR
jgi:hypothetical protein